MTHQITITEANTLIARFQSQKQDILDGLYSEVDVFSNCQTFEVASVNSMLAQSGTTGLRAYFGMYDDSSAVPTSKRNKIVLVLCSADESGNDLGLAPTQSGSGILILEDAILCPHVCPASSQINNL
jgi:hypothetical protein